MEKSLADNIISRLLRVGKHTGEQVRVSESKVLQLCQISSRMFLMEPSLLELKAPIKIAGDVHGQYSDLLTIFKYGGFPDHQSKYLFLGNYVDFGRQSLETILLLLAFKIKYPDRFFLLRGSHECASTNRLFGFHDECERRLNVESWKVFNDCFNCLPISALINDKILCIHGGLSPDLHNLDQLRHIQRPTSVPASGLLSNLLWSDPSTHIQGWRMIEHYRSYSFGTEKVKEFVEKNGLSLICRGHQIAKNGFEYFAGQRLVTIISVPSSSTEFDNIGVLMNVDANLKCSFQNLAPVIPSRVLKLATKPRSSSGGDILNIYDEEAPWIKHTERITKSEYGSSTSATRPQNSTRVNPSKSTPATKHRSKLPEVKPAESTRKSSSGSKNSATDDNGSSTRANFVANISSKFRDTSPNAKIAARTSNSSFGIGTGATKPEGSLGANPAGIDLAAKYRSASPGVKVIEYVLRYAKRSKRISH